MNVTIDPAHRPALPRAVPLPSWGGRTVIMGILNVTPDSFFDGGRHVLPEAAEIRARRMQEEGADWIDIGAESTRPGAQSVGEDEELRRILPAIARVRAASGLPISVDTTKAAVARAALATGATWVNDIWGLQGDTAMAEVIAEARASVVIMHNQSHTDYPSGPVDAINRFFENSLQIATRANIPLDRIVLDPGIGFGKTPAQNLAVLRELASFSHFRRPLLIGVSRKSVIGHVLDLPVSDRLEGSLATTVAGVAAGVAAVRVHDVQAQARAARMADALYR